MFNWARTVKLCEKTQIVRPEDEVDLVGILKRRHPRQKVKVKGAGMSCLGIGSVDKFATTEDEGDIVVDLTSFSGLLDFGKDYATFGAATPLQDVSDVLISRGRQITACAGVLLTQTLAGAIATGTHGQGFRNGGLYDSVRRIRAVLADGSIHEYSSEDKDLDMFNAFRLHLGSLGVLTSVTIETEPLSTYKLVKAVTDFDDLFENFVSWNESSSHCKAWWFPTTDHVQVWRSFHATPSECEFYSTNGSTLVPIPSNKSSDTNFLETIDHLVQKLDEDTKSHGGQIESSTQDPYNEHNARFRTITRFRSMESCLGNMYQLWCKGIPAPQINCELAIPLEKLPDALHSLRNYTKETKHELHYPFIFRATGASSALLSASYSKRVCYIGFLVYLSEEDYSANEESFEILREVEILLSTFGAIPHFGKFLTMSHYNFPQLLPKWWDFLRIRNTVDPHGVFLNKFLEELFHNPKRCNRSVLNSKL